MQKESIQSVAILPMHYAGNFENAQFAGGNQTMVSEVPMFSEIVFDETEPQAAQLTDEAQIKLRGQNVEVQRPLTYPVDHLVKMIFALEGPS